MVDHRWLICPCPWTPPLMPPIGYDSTGCNRLHAPLNGCSSGHYTKFGPSIMPLATTIGCLFLQDSAGILSLYWWILNILSICTTKHNLNFDTFYIMKCPYWPPPNPNTVGKLRLSAFQWYQSKTICENKNVSYEAHLCPIIVKAQRARNAQATLQIIDRHYEELKSSRRDS